MKFWDRAWSLVEGCTKVSECYDQCERADVPFYLKHLNKKEGRILDGRTHDELPWRRNK